MTRSIRTALILLGMSAAFLIQPACGRKGAPRPAEEVLPETITDLAATATDKGIKLSWDRPRKYTGGDRMQDLGGFWVQRSDSPGASFETINTIDVTDLQRFQQTKHFDYVDSAAAADRTYEYRVVSFTVDRYVSAPSNIVAARRTAAPANGDTTGSSTAPE